MDLGARDSARLEILSGSPGALIGLAFDAFAGLLSTIAALIILTLIFYRMYRDHRNWKPMDIYVIALFAAEVVQGIAHTTEVKWAIEGKSYTGPFCTAQGAMQQLGETGVALATLTIALQTFVTIWWLKDPTYPIALAAVGLQWLFIILFVAIGFAVHTDPPGKYYATPTPFWCWLGQGFTAERLAGEYIWFWITLFGSIVLYIPLFLLHLEVIRPGRAWYLPRLLDQIQPAQAAPSVEPVASQTWTCSKCHANEQVPEVGEPGTSQVGSRTAPSSLGTAILYPILYCVLVLPLSVIRWIGFRQEATDGASHISPVATFIAAILFTLSGILNALLYRFTRTEIFKEEKGFVIAPDVPVTN